MTADARQAPQDARRAPQTADVDTGTGDAVKPSDSDPDRSKWPPWSKPGHHRPKPGQP